MSASGRSIWHAGSPLWGRRQPSVDPVARENPPSPDSLGSGGGRRFSSASRLFWRCRDRSTALVAACPVRGRRGARCDRAAPEAEGVTVVSSRVFASAIGVATAADPSKTGDGGRELAGEGRVALVGPLVQQPGPAEAPRWRQPPLTNELVEGAHRNRQKPAACSRVISVNGASHAFWSGNHGENRAGLMVGVTGFEPATPTSRT